MQLRRMFTAFVLTLGVSLIFLGHQADPQADGRKPYDGDLRILDQAREAGSPPTLTVPTPKGDRKVQSVEVGHYDIPLTALLAYQRAADIMAVVKPSCDLPWTLLAAIGRVESNHGRYADATLGTDGVSSPQVIGVALDGAGPVAKVPDTDNGRWDRDRTWDRAVGPMQFLPATWQMVGVDGDGDGTRSIDDVDDAALAAGVYLCAGPEQNLGTREAMDSALHRYNDSDAYAALVLAYEKLYRGGDFEVVSESGQVAAASAALSGHPLTGEPLEARGKKDTRERARLEAETRRAGTKAEKTGGTTPGISAKPSPATRTTKGDAGAGGTTAGAGPATGSTSPGTTSPAAPSDSATGDLGSPSTGAPSDGATSPSTPAPSGSDTATPGGSDTDSESTGSSGASGSGGSSATPSETDQPEVCTDPSETATPSPTPDQTPTESPTCDPEAIDPNADATCEALCELTPGPTP